MSLTEEYKRQFAWRNWETTLNLCSIAPGQKVLDLGCGPGDIAQELVKRGAEVVGVDANQELLQEARKRNLKNCTFIKQDLKSLDFEQESFDGIWCSFTSAYFTNFEEVLHKWKSFLKPTGWICITEMDDLFGHHPLSNDLRAKLNSFYERAYKNGLYDFRAGHKLGAILKGAGFEIREILLSGVRSFS